MQTFFAFFFCDCILSICCFRFYTFFFYKNVATYINVFKTPRANLDAKNTLCHRSKFNLVKSDKLYRSNKKCIGHYRALNACQKEDKVSKEKIFFFVRENNTQTTSTNTKFM